MLDVLSLMLPIFSLIGIGFLFAHQNWYPKEGFPYLNKFVMNACLPVLLFAAISNQGSLSEISWHNSLLYGIASLVAAFLLWWVLRHALHGTAAQSYILAMGAGSANSVFLGFPIASLFIPDRAQAVFSWVVISEIAIIFPVFTTLAMLADGKQDGKAILSVLGALIRSPVSIGILSGITFLATGLTLPNSASGVIDLVIQAAPYPALFVIGGSLLQFRLQRTGPRVLVISVTKLFMQPLLVAALFSLVYGWSNDVSKDAVLFASMPLFLSFVAFSGKYGAEDVAASSIVLTTLISALTITALLVLVV